MYYELEIFDDLVLNKLNPSKRTVDTNSTLEEWLSIAYNENCKIKVKLVDDVLQQPDESHIEVFIHTLQKRLIILANELYNYLGVDYFNPNSSVEETLTLQSVQRLTYLIIEDQLTFIEEHFGRFFNVDERPTKRDIIITIMHFTNKFNDILALSDEPNKFLNAVISELNDFISNPETLTYRKITYLQKLTNEIVIFKNHEVEKDLSQYIIDKMIYLNFNAVPFINVVTNDYESNVKQLDLINDKIEKLSWFFKNVCQALVHPTLIYLPKQKSAKELLSMWIIEEMAFLEKKVVLSALGEKEVITKFNSGIKIHTESSVSELAFFLKILFDLEVIYGISVQDLSVFYATYYRTKKTESVSSESLRKSFYAIDPHAVEKVKDLIIKMLNYIQNKNTCWILLSTSLVSNLQDSLLFLPLS